MTDKGVGTTQSFGKGSLCQPSFKAKDTKARPHPAQQGGRFQQPCSDLLRSICHNRRNDTINAEEMEKCISYSII